MSAKYDIGSKNDTIFELCRWTIYIFSGGGKETSFVKDLAVPGNRVCAVESGWLLKEKKRKEQC